MCRIPISERSPERRNAARYNLRLPVLFHWKDGEERTNGGFTRDVGLKGALILSKVCPPVGTNVRVEVLIPSPDRHGEDLRIECIAKITRVVEKSGCQAFGIHGTLDDKYLSQQ